MTHPKQPVCNILFIIISPVPVSPEGTIGLFSIYLSIPPIVFHTFSPYPFTYSTETIYIYMYVYIVMEIALSRLLNIGLLRSPIKCMFSQVVR